MERVTVGLIVNPISGMGGSVGLKGTDGEAAAAAIALGARAVSPGITRSFLDAFSRHDDVAWLAPPAEMGEALLTQAGIDCSTVGNVSKPSSARDTISAALAMKHAGVHALVFVGGDGTARNMVEAIGLDLPVIGVPAGVKVYSAAFANSPGAAARLLESLLQGADLAEEEVLDLDEEAYRAGRVVSKHYGFLLVPFAESLIQSGKESSDISGSASENKKAIAEHFVEAMREKTLYLLGTGTTIKHIGDRLGLETTLLGIDAVLDGELVGKDLRETQILDLLNRHCNAVIVVTPLGGSGFILGRGNKPLTPRVIRRVGLSRIRVIANRDKLLRLSRLLADTGDVSLDNDLAGYINVVVGPDHEKLMRVN